MNEKNEEKIAIEDSTPSILEQAAYEGWVCEYYNFGKAEGLGYEWFNPSIVERPDGLWLLCRGSEPHPEGFQFGQNYVWAFSLDETGTTPKMGKRLQWQETEPSQHFEDPRGFHHPRINQTIVGACTFIWYSHSPWTGPLQCVGAFDKEWNCLRMAYPKIGGNPGEMVRIEKHENYEKNWLWWLAEERLHLLYKARPWQVYRFGETWTDFDSFKDEAGASWKWGDIRGGTPPVQVGDYYFTFHHSSLPWKGRYRRYYAGCVAFEAKPPYRPRLITRSPLLIGSQNDPWAQTKPLVVFPCGAIFRGDGWFITLGVNDMKAAWLRIPHESLLRKMTPIEGPKEIFMASGLSEKEQKQIFSSAAPVGDENRDTNERGVTRHRSTADAVTPSEISGNSVARQRVSSSRKTRKRKKSKFSPQALENLRAAAAKARAAKKQKDDLGDSMDANTAPDPNFYRDQNIRGA